jgi:hypothetical protein
MKITPAEARAQGYTIDQTCYPWVAYKGERFSTHDWRWIYTDDEAELLGCLTAARSVAKEAGALWDADQDMKVGKILMALGGDLQRYRPDTDAINTVLAKHGRAA